MEVNEWPESQICIECKFAHFLLGGSSQYACEKNFVAGSEECEENRIQATQEEWDAKFK